MISPGDSFVVRFTPPRAGTFIYHVHGESGEELASGLYGALIVLDRGAKFDAQTDRIFLLSDGGPGAIKPVFANGTATPDTIEMRVGTTYRVRVIVISANDVFALAFAGPSGAAPLRYIAADGYDLAATKGPLRPINPRLGPGHTLDFTFTPTDSGLYYFSAQRVALGAEVGATTGPVTRVPIRVRTP